MIIIFITIFLHRLPYSRKQARFLIPPKDCILPASWTRVSHAVHTLPGSASICPALPSSPNQTEKCSPPIYTSLRFVLPFFLCLLIRLTLMFGIQLFACLTLLPGKEKSFAVYCTRAPRVFHFVESMLENRICVMFNIYARMINTFLNQFDFCFLVCCFLSFHFLPAAPVLFAADYSRKN